MKRYILRRLFTAAITVLGITVLTFAISHIIPGDPARLAAGPTATEESIQALRKQMGLDQPLVTQYVHYLEGLTRLDFGRSIITRQPVREDLLRRFPATLELVLVSFLMYVLLGIPMGVFSALTRGRWPDLLIRTFAIVGYAVPLFLTALWLQYSLYYKLGWFPSGDRLPILADPPIRVTGFYLVDTLVAGNFQLFVTAAHHLAMPAISLALSWLALAARFTRASMLAELDKDYIKMARMKGLKRMDVVIRHALRNSLIPLVTITGIQLGYFIGGSVLVETVFLWPGIGFYAYSSTVSLDYAPVMGVTIVTAFVFVIANLLIDLLYPVLDPRIQLAGVR